MEPTYGRREPAVSSIAHREFIHLGMDVSKAIATTYSHYLATVKLRDTALESVEADLLPWCENDPFGDQVQRLAAYRGVTRIGALSPPRCSTGVGSQRRDRS
jgi:hypothetical protein